MAQHRPRAGVPIPVLVSDVMRTEIRTLGLEASIVSAADKMAETNSDTLLVTRAGEVMGVMTGKELAECVSQGHSSRDECFVFRHMRLDVRTARPSMDSAEAARIMLASDVTRLPVVDDGRLVGEVHLGDVVQPGVDHPSSSTAATS